MQQLTDQADCLKQEQLRLKQCINEKHTASILVGLFSRREESEGKSEDPRIEELLRRTPDDIPDAAKLPELPALILPGQHNSKKRQNPSSIANKEDIPDDGIDYELLGKDRSKCTQEELDQIRRERNRMHAKRTRDRKRHFMEEMSELCKRLEDENQLLQGHLDALCGNSSGSRARSSSVISPEMSSALHKTEPATISMSSPDRSSSAKKIKHKPTGSRHGVTFDQITTLLEAANTFSGVNGTSAVSASSHSSDGESLPDTDDERPTKRPKQSSIGKMLSVTTVPGTITTDSSTPVGC